MPSSWQKVAYRLPIVSRYGSHLYRDTFPEVIGSGVVGTLTNYTVYKTKTLRNKSPFSFRFLSQGPLNVGVSNGGVSRSGLVLPFLSFFVLLELSRGFSRFVRGTLRGFSRLVLFLFLGLLSAPTRNSPERVRDTIWTFPEKSGKHPGLETPRFSFSQKTKPMLHCDFKGL